MTRFVISAKIENKNKMTRATKNTDERIARIDAIFNKLEQAIKQDPDSASFSFDYLGTDWGDPSLKDTSVLKKTLDRIKEATTNEVDWQVTSKTIKHEGTYPVPDKKIADKLIINLERPSAIKEYRQQTKEFLEKPTAKNQEVRRLIHKDKSGDFYYKDKKIVIPTGTLYYDIFDLLLTQSDQNGFLSYKQIEEMLNDRGHAPTGDEEKRNARIQNAITNENQGLFRNAKVGNTKLTNKVPIGGSLIEVVRGKGLKINNPIL